MRKCLDFIFIGWQIFHVFNVDDTFPSIFQQILPKTKNKTLKVMRLLQHFRIYEIERYLRMMIRIRQGNYYILFHEKYQMKKRR